MTRNVKTKYRGVCKTNNRYVAHIRADGRVFYLGIFLYDTLAARAWDAAVYWLKDHLSPTRQPKDANPFAGALAHSYNFPDENTPDNPPLVSKRLAEIMTELRIPIPENAPRETPFVDTFNMVMDDWFKENPTAVEWRGTCAELNKIFKYALAFTERQLGRALRELDCVTFRRSNGQNLIIFSRASVTGSPVAKRNLRRDGMRPVEIAFKRLISNQNMENYQKVLDAFSEWRTAAIEALSPASIQSKPQPNLATLPNGEAN